MENLNFKIKEIISKTFEISQNNIDIKLIEHSILDRNYVFIFNVKEKEYVIKISFNKEKWINEINTLILLGNYYFSPNILDRNTYDNINYIIMDKIPGNILVENIKKFDELLQIKILEKLGENLGLIHSTGSYKYYGWEKKKSISSLIETRKLKDKNIIKRVNKFVSEENGIIEKGIEVLNKDRLDLKELKPNLTHKDFSLRNILVDNKGNITGIIDYEHSEPEDPCLDICSMFHTNILDNEINFNSFKKGYEKILKFPENFINNKRYYMINTGLYLYGRFGDKGIGARKRGIELIKNSLNS